MTHPTDAERMRDKCAAHLHALLAHEQDMVVRALEVRPISTESLRDAMYRAGTCEGYRLAEAAIRALPASDGAANDEAARGRVRTDAGRLVGALLDAWDGVPNDERPPKLERPFRAIYAAIEDETFYATPAPSLPAAPAPTRPRVSTAGSGQEARLVVTPAAPVAPSRVSRSDEVCKAVGSLFDAYDGANEDNLADRLRKPMAALHRLAEKGRLYAPLPPSAPSRGGEPVFGYYVATKDGKCGVACGPFLVADDKDGAMGARAMCEAIIPGRDKWFPDEAPHRVVALVPKESRSDDNEPRQGREEAP